jgi:DNA-binding CsgD family transcriptional regulator
MRPSTERLIKEAPALRKPDEVLDMLQRVSLKHPQRLKVTAAGCRKQGPHGFEGQMKRDIFFHPDFPAAQWFAEYQSLRQKHGYDAFADYLCSVSHSFTLSEALHALRLTGEARWTFDFLAEFGLRDGFFVTHGHWAVAYSAEQPLRLERAERFQLSMAASVAVEWLEHFVKARRRQLTAPDTPELSDREKHVLRLLAAGLTTDEIAGQLHISSASVRTYIHRMLEKLGARNSIHAVSIAWRSGLFDN